MLIQGVYFGSSGCPNLPRYLVLVRYDVPFECIGIKSFLILSKV